MKTLSFMTLFLFTVLILNSQNSNFDYYFNGNVGSKLTYGIYTSSDSRIATQTIEITNKTQVADTFYITYKSKIANTELNYKVKMYDSICFLDMVGYLNLANFVNSGATTLYPAWWIAYPANLVVGQDIEGFRYERKYSKSTQVTKYFDRKVLELDTIKTNAGSFECYKIFYRIESDQAQGKYSTLVTEWVNKDLGLIRQENAASSGRMDVYTLLESVSIK